MAAGDDTTASIRHAKDQVALVELLSADLDIAFTFLKTAQIDAHENPEHYSAALAKAEGALNTLRRFEPRVADLATRRDINGRAQELAGMIDALREENSKALRRKSQL